MCRIKSLFGIQTSSSLHLFLIITGECTYGQTEDIDEKVDIIHSIVLYRNKTKLLTPTLEAEVLITLASLLGIEVDLRLRPSCYKGC